MGGFGSSFEAIRRPSGPGATRLVNHSRLGQDLLEMRDPAIRALFVSANNPAVTCPDAAAVRRRWELESRPEFSGTPEIRIYTNRPLDETIRTVVGAVWAAL